MERRSISAILLAAVLAFAMLLSACGAKPDGGAASDSAASTSGAAKSEDKETVVTAQTQEEAKKLAEDFYANLLKANPVAMTAYANGEVLSEFVRSGDAIYSGTPDLDFAYYLFIEDGKKYLLDSDEGVAYENEFMYDMVAESLQTTLAMFVTGYYEAEDEDGELQFSATRTDKTVNGAVSSKLVSVITGEDDGKAASVTVTGTAENGVVSNILCEIESGEEKENYEFRFSYGSVTVDLPPYTIGEGYGDYYNEPIEGEHVESPYRTLSELIATLGEDEQLFYTVEEGRVYAIGEKDGRQYQFGADISEADSEAYFNLDFFSDTYEQDVYAILGKLAVDECIDFTDCLVPQSELDTFVGQTVEDLVNAGYELTGWSIFGGDALLSFEKGLMDYDAKVTPTEGFDENSEYDGEDLYGFRVNELYFSAPEYMALPIR